MGFKLKKKNTGESTGRKGGNAFFTKIQSQIDPLYYIFFIVCHVATNSLKVWVIYVSSRKRFRAKQLKQPLRVHRSQ